MQQQLDDKESLITQLRHQLSEAGREFFTLVSA